MVESMDFRLLLSTLLQRMGIETNNRSSVLALSKYVLVVQPRIVSRILVPGSSKSEWNNTPSWAIVTPSPGFAVTQLREGDEGM
jgi:hypothetical protein